MVLSVGLFRTGEYLLRGIICHTGCLVMRRWGYHKFHDKEYAKWGQVAVIGKRRPANRGCVLKADIVAMQERCEVG